MKLQKLLKFIPVKTVYAHCDIPCGIYDPQAAQTAAKTVLVMVQKIQAQPEPEIDSDKSAVDYTNTVVRMILNKEEHASICKKELLILWTDYFKPEHLKAFPDLHETFWKAAKLCSYNKQHIEEDKAQELVEAVDKIAQIFADSKK